MLIVGAERSKLSRSPILVGRERDLAVLRAALDGAIAGGGRVVLVSGEPGIGKTRLARELAADARGRGTDVLWGTCGETGAQQGFRPWVRILRDYVRERRRA